ncbi:MAG: FAA hydrolase family protein [Candidatus Moranbacteria bacterium]|nr:FAA hydrolase family protein [Candidatus Moranbacteria bacterium]
MKIFCIGMNYLNHVAELNNKVPEKPVFFMKPETALVKPGMPFFYPDFSKEIHHEVELVLRIKKLGKNISEKFASTYYHEIGIGIDFTARDLQRECKQKGLPWEMAKAFDGSGPVSAFVPIESLENPDSIVFCLKKNGVIVQEGKSTDMIFGFDRLVSHLSGFSTLKIGDLIFTGTPEGVGPVEIGDHLECFLENKKMLDIKVK